MFKTSYPKTNYQWLVKCSTILPVIFSTMLPIAAVAQVTENTTDSERIETLQRIDSYSSYLRKRSKRNQVTNVFQLRDVSPRDWAFEALRTLVERYGCIEGYPNRTFRGNRALSRYEFAAGLNACLQQIERLLASNQSIVQEDIQRLQRLLREFEAELASVGARVDNLEGRVAFLEDNQFSTTTKLRGEASFSLSSVFGEEFADDSGEELDSIPVFDHRVRFHFDTSFSGDDLLKVRLDSLNTVPFGPGEEGFPNITGTNETRLAFDESTDSSIVVGKLLYSFRVGEVGGGSHSHGGGGHSHGGEKDSRHSHGPGDSQLYVVFDAVGGEFNENFENFNEAFAEEITGAISRFGRFNPIYYQGLEGMGLSLNYQFNDLIGVSAGYLAPDGAVPEAGEGLFNGSFAAIAQATVEPTETLEFGLTYVRAFYPGDEVVVSGETGSELANEPFGDIPTAADHLGLQVSYQLNSWLTVSGWGGLTLANAEDNGVNDGFVVEEDADATIYNWAVTLALRDIGKEGSLLGFIFGQPPRVSFNEGGPDEDEAWHLETQYRYQLTDNIAINPGFFVILNPENNDENTAIYVGSIRTIFEF